MNLRLFRFVIFLIITQVFFSCIPQKKLDYLQDPLSDENSYKLQKAPVNYIKPNDELYITVNSFDDLSFNYFNNSNDISRTGFSNELSVSLISYSVQVDGTIYFPVLGNIQLAGLTLDEARDFMAKQLRPYFNQPVVSMKFAYKKFTVLGEVNSPGNFIYSKDKISIFDALGMAGDLSVHGDREDIYLLRTVNDSIRKTRVDLTNDELVFSDNYYLQPDDILYVKARDSKTWSTISIPVSLVLSSMSTLLVLMTYFQTINNR